MTELASPDTSETLLGRLRRRPRDERAWGEFARRYGAAIHRWCRRWHLQDADAADVTQEVLLKLSRVMSDFEYDPTLRFRSWLKTAAHNAWQDMVKGRREFCMGDSGHSAAIFHSLEAREDLSTHLEAEWDLELLQHACKRVRLRVHPRTWDAFRLTTLGDLTGQQAAERLGMPLASVYKAKSNVQKLVREEIAAIEAAEDA